MPDYYRIARTGHLLGEGISDAIRVDLSAIAKRNTDEAPYCVPNELICGELGRLLGLPIPPVGLIASSAGKLAEVMFASLDFNFTGSSPLMINSIDCVKAFPEICAGILIFDIWIGNSDRHRKNLAVDSARGPKQLVVFDHSHALMGAQRNKAISHLNATKRGLAITGSAWTGGQRHCFLDKITNPLHFQPWLNKVREIPQFMIDDVMSKVSGLGATTEELGAAREFLCYRKTNLRDIITDNASEFKGIAQLGILI